MKTNKLFFAIATMLLLGFASATAQIRNPAPSFGATVSQVIGVTNVDIEYSSPGVKGREGKVWGTLIPNDFAWRAGANQPTKITFEDDVTIDGKEVKKGSYNIFVTPSASGDWLVHINKGGSVFTYFGKDGNPKMDSLKSMDAATVKTKVAWASSSQERLKYTIDYVSDSEGKITMSWEKAMVSFTVKVATKKITASSIERQIGNWFSFANSALYYMNNDLDMKKAENWAAQSVVINEKHFFPRWANAQVLTKQGKFVDALMNAQKAKELGDAAGGGFYNNNKEAIAKAIKELETKVPAPSKKKKKKKKK